LLGALARAVASGAVAGAVVEGRGQDSWCPGSVAEDRGQVDWRGLAVQACGQDGPVSGMVAGAVLEDRGQDERFQGLWPRRSWRSRSRVGGCDQRKPSKEKNEVTCPRKAMQTQRALRNVATQDYANTTCPFSSTPLQCQQASLTPNT
jgi:hypothetical protein